MLPHAFGAYLLRPLYHGDLFLPDRVGASVATALQRRFGCNEFPVAHLNCYNPRCRLPAFPQERLRMVPRPDAQQPIEGHLLA